MGTKLQEARIKKGLSQRMLGQRIGYARQYLAHIEQRQRAASRKLQSIIAAELGGSEADFFEESGLAK